MRVSPQEFEDFLMELALNYCAQIMDLDGTPIEDRGRLLAEQRRILESLRRQSVQSWSVPTRIGRGNIY